MVILRMQEKSCMRHLEGFVVVIGTAAAISITVANTLMPISRSESNVHCLNIIEMGNLI